MLRRPALVALAIALVVPLAACTEATRIPDAEPSSAVAPLFASDEEALAAATAAYEEFLDVSGQILRDGGAQPERLEPLVSDEVYQSEADGFSTFVANGWRAIGQSTLEGSILQQHVAGPPGAAEVQIYVCVSLGSTDVLDASGKSVVDPSRPEQQAFEALFTSRANGQLLLEAESVWGGGGVCEA
jgi:hypothetical protein